MKGRIKVLYLVPQPKRPGDLAKYPFLNEEIRALADAGVEPFVLYRRELPAATPAYLSSAVLPFVARSLPWIPLRNLTSRACLPTYIAEECAAAVVRREKIDLVHSHFAWPGGSGGLLTKFATGRPLVASLRGNDIVVEPEIGYGARAEGTFDRAVRRLLAGADRTVYFSEWMRHRGEDLGAPPERCRVVRKGVDLARFHPAASRAESKARLGLNDRPMLLSVAGLIPRKGIEDVLAALSALRLRHDFNYVVCGEGPLAVDLRRTSEDLGLAAQTSFVGRVSREVIPEYFQACDIFVHAPLLEAAGNVLLEAMACGRPVVCTDAGGPAEYVRDGVTGFVVPVRDPQALARSIGLLLDSPDLAEQMGRAGRAIAEQHADYSTMTAKILSIYEEVLRGSAQLSHSTDRGPQ